MIQRNQVQILPEIPTVQYASGKTLSRRVDGGGRFQSYVGFHMQCGRDATIDEIFHRIGLPMIEIKHQRPGSVETVRHWDLGESIRLFPVTAGPVARTMAGCMRGAAYQQTIEAGIGIRWGEQERSRLAIRGFLDLLAQHHLVRLIQLTVRGRMTDRLLRALIDHGRVCEQADELIHRDQHPEPVMFHELALPLVAGDEETWGAHATVAVVPFRSAHPETITASDVRGLWRSRAVHEAALTEWPNILVWARSYATLT